MKKTLIFLTSFLILVACDDKESTTITKHEEQKKRSNEQKKENKKNTEKKEKDPVCEPLTIAQGDALHLSTSQALYRYKRELQRQEHYIVDGLENKKTSLKSFQSKKEQTLSFLKSEYLLTGLSTFDYMGKQLKEFKEALDLKFIDKSPSNRINVKFNISKNALKTSSNLAFFLNEVKRTQESSNLAIEKFSDINKSLYNSIKTDTLKEIKEFSKNLFMIRNIRFSEIPIVTNLQYSTEFAEAFRNYYYGVKKVRKFAKALLKKIDKYPQHKVDINNLIKFFESTTPTNIKNLEDSLADSIKKLESDMKGGVNAMTFKINPENDQGKWSKYKMSLKTNTETNQDKLLENIHNDTIFSDASSEKVENIYGVNFKLMFEKLETWKKLKKKIEFYNDALNKFRNTFQQVKTINDLETPEFIETLEHLSVARSNVTEVIDELTLSIKDNNLIEPLVTDKKELDCLFMSKGQ